MKPEIKPIEARGLNTLVFDRLYDSLILSSLLLTLGTNNTGYCIYQTVQ